MEVEKKREICLGPLGKIIRFKTALFLSLEGRRLVYKA